MLLYAVDTYGERMMSGTISTSHAGILALLFFVAELIMVPVVAAVIQNLGSVVESRPAYHDAFTISAIVPTPLWLSSLALFIPSLTVIALVSAAALYVAAGLVAWVVLMGITFVAWSWAVS